MGNRKPLSSKMKKKLSQRRASRSRKQQKQQLPPHENAVEQQAARHWTWVLQLTTLETRAQKRRFLPNRSYSHFSKYAKHVQLYTFTYLVCLYSCFKSSVRESTSSGIADLLVIDPSPNQGTKTGNYILLHKEY